METEAEGEAEDGRGRGGGRESHVNENDNKRDKSKVKCFRCDKVGHYARECPDKNRGGEVNLIQANDDHVLMMGISQECVSETVLLNEKICVNLLASGGVEWSLKCGISTTVQATI